MDTQLNPELIQKYRDEATRIEEDSLFSAKGHYNASDRWRYANLWLGIPNATLAAIAGVCTFAGAQVAGGCLAIVVAALSAVMTFLNPGDRASTHTRCGGEYHSLRNRSRVFRGITCESCDSGGELSARFEELMTKRDDLNASSPQIPRAAYEQAKKSIEKGESTHKV